MTKKPEREPLPPNHPFVTMRRMLFQSVGRWPAPLVLILALSLSLAVLSGVALKMASTSSKAEFLPLRLKTDPGKAVDEAVLQGAWGYSKDGLAMSIRLENGMFEWIIRPQGEKYLRYFARGNYLLKDDVLVLAQRPDLGKPAAPVGQMLQFLPYGLTNINLKVETNGKLMLWLVPSGERARQSFSSVFPSDPAKPLIWARIPVR